MSKRNQEYLRKLEEKNRMLKMKKEAELTDYDREMKERERMFSTHFRGANDTKNNSQRSSSKVYDFQVNGSGQKPYCMI